MRGNPNDTSSPFLIFSTHLRDHCAKTNEDWADTAEEKLKERKIPYKRVSLRAFGDDDGEANFIVDAADDFIAKAFALTFGHESVISVDSRRIGTRVSASLAGRGTFDSNILGTLKPALRHKLARGDQYLLDQEGTLWSWQ